MALGFQTSGWIDRYAATNPGISSFADDGSIRNRGAHRQREWICDRWSSQDFLHCESLLELREGIVDRVFVVLGGNHCQLSASRSVAIHMIARKGGIHVHEHAIR